MRLEDIRALLDFQDLEPEVKEFIKEVPIKDADGYERVGVISLGWDLVSANKCDKEWGEFNVRLLDYVDRLNCSDSERDGVLNSLFLEDSHWDWLTKSCCYIKDEYKWFYLIVENSVEAVCLMYQPKSSVIESKNVFYIEFIAVAPWNRDNPLEGKRFRGLGSILISCVARYAIDVLRLEPGFSLHSLPKASSYYERIGMINVPGYEKEGMKYFEMLGEATLKMVG